MLRSTRKRLHLFFRPKNALLQFYVQPDHKINETLGARRPCVAEVRLSVADSDPDCLPGRSGRAKAALISAPGGVAGAAPPLLLRCGIFKLAIRRMAMHCDFMNWGNEIVTLEAVPTRVGDGWRILIEWVSGRIQYISWFDTLQDAEDWIENNARSWVSSARNRL
jgi:hypothetical protein